MRVGLETNLFVSYCVWILMFGHIGCSNVTIYEKIRSDLLGRPAAVHKYPPLIDSTDDRPFTLTYKLMLIDVKDVDQINQMMTILAYIQVEWFQRDLGWNSSEHNMDKVLLDASSIWVPRIVVLIGSGDSLLLKLNDEILVFSSGKIQSMLETYITFRCQIDFRKYPFDTQRCTFGFYYENVAFNSAPIKIEIEDISGSSVDYVTRGEWELLDMEKVMFQDANDQEYPRYTVVVRRRSVYYVVTVVFPMVLTSAMIPLVFLIPTKTGEKISYLVTMFTSTAIFLGYISSVMPRGLSSLPYMAILLIEVLCEGLAAVLATLWVVNTFENAEYIDKQNTSKVHPIEVENVSSETNQQNTDTQGPIRSTNLEPRPIKSTHLEHRPIKSTHLKDGPIKSTSCKLRLQIQRIDRCLFILFATFQVIFSIILFCATDWTN